MKELKHSELLFPNVRPPCPRCGSHHVISKGVEWQCALCHRRWMKKVTIKIKEEKED